MFLAAQQAQDIVEEIGAIVKQNINMMDERGVIIASTDKDRIGSFHEAAKRIIDEELSELYVTEEAAVKAVPPMRVGINLPIEYQHHIVGVIGVTGEYEHVIGFGQIVKKMTEILIREREREDEKRLDLRVISRFLEDWVLGAGILRPTLLEERGRQLGIDINRPRRVMVVSMDDVEDYIDSLPGQELIENIENAVLDIIHRDPSALVLRNAARQILLLPETDDEKLAALAKELRVMVRERFGQSLRIGIDGISRTMNEAYGQADRAWRIAANLDDKIVLFSRLDLGMFLQEISTQTKFDYLHKIFHAYSIEDRKPVIEVLRAYFAADGSLSKAAEKLFIHKNTLQYKLQRIAQRTGYDVRKPRDASVLAMAVLFFDETQRNKVSGIENE